MVTSAEMWCLLPKMQQLCCKVFLGTTKYYTVLLGATKYYKVLHSTARYCSVLQTATRHHRVPLRTTYYSILQSTLY